ncbi:hypothetical protein V6N12_048225 [Hibiscus sabdariffa]|uniref:Uncharacterized protein n=1 Tax=Hibiscus sabdariffa TaxID=183260 RepID=A0ABR2EGP1_9ROSI
MRYSIPLEAAEKQGVLEDARTEPEIKVVVVSQMLFAEIVVFGFTMDETIMSYIPHALITKRLISLFYVNVEPMRYSIPLEAAVKQGVLKDARTEPELKVVVVSQMLFDEIVVL